jgi:hypothetical protein
MVQRSLRSNEYRPTIQNLVNKGNAGRTRRSPQASHAQPACLIGGVVLPGLTPHAVSEVFSLGGGSVPLRSLRPLGVASTGVVVCLLEEMVAPSFRGKKARIQ